MSDLRIEQVDPADDAAVAAWHATYLASATFERPHATPWMLPEAAAAMRGDGPGERRLDFAGSVGDEVVVVGTVELTLLDNLDRAWIAVEAHPAHRRRGHGSAMLDHLLGVVRAEGRGVVATEAAFPYDSPADGAGHPYADFLRHRGFTFCIGDVQRILDLPADDAMLAGLEAEAAPYHGDYELRQFIGPVPDDIIVSFGELIGALAVEAPTGEMELEREVYTPERIRADEEVFEASGRTKYTTVAIAPDGTVAAYSEIAVPEHDPGRAYQWGTLALPEHRGHRLGLATKVHNLRWLQRERPDLRLLSTFNAEVNSHMIGVNERMGFRPVERLGEYELRL